MSDEVLENEELEEDTQKDMYMTFKSGILQLEFSVSMKL